MKTLLVCTVFLVLSSCCKKECPNPIGTSFRCFSEGKEYIHDFNVRRLKIENGVWTYITTVCEQNMPCFDIVRKASGNCYLEKNYLFINEACED